MAHKQTKGSLSVLLSFSRIDAVDLHQHSPNECFYRLLNLLLGRGSRLQRNLSETGRLYGSGNRTYCACNHVSRVVQRPSSSEYALSLSE